MHDRDRLIADRAATRHGVFTIDEAREAGFSRHDVEYRIGTRQWLVAYRGVYRVAGAPMSWRSELVAACLAGGTTGVASHRSAAELWQLPGGTQDVVEITCARWRRTRAAGFVIHETKASNAYDRRIIDAIPVTSPGRTLLDLGAVYGDHTVERALEAALRRGIVSLSQLDGFLGRLGRSGRNGAGVLRRVLERRGGHVRTTESDPEIRIIQLLVRHGLPRPVRQHIVRIGAEVVARLDLSYPDLKIAIEYDSFQEHVGATALVRDSARRNTLSALGWVVLVATWEDIRSGGSEFARRVQSTRRARTLTPQTR